MIDISEERYKELLAAESKLDKLEAGGVDNWQGYDYCFQDDEDEE